MRYLRTIEWTNQFKRDYKRDSQGQQHRAALDADLMPIIAVLANDQPLAPRHCDHALTGAWKRYRDCHIKPDLVLLYQTLGNTILRLVRIGSPSKLGLGNFDSYLAY
jgi:mRNA interferase YafQ